MSIALATVIAAAISAVGYVVVAWLSGRRQRRQVQDLHDRLGNGFSQEVIEGLGALNGRLDRQAVQIGALTNRLNAHVNIHAQGVTASGRQKPR